ncbi:MAG: MarR family transcriptional regulator [Pseudomonadota bacterium]
MAEFSIRAPKERVTDPADPAGWGEIQAGELQENFMCAPGPLDLAGLQAMWHRALRYAVLGREPACLFTDLSLDTRGRGSVQAYGLIPSEHTVKRDRQQERGIFLTQFIRSVARDPADLAEMLYDSHLTGLPPYLLDLDRPEGFFRYVDTGLDGAHWFLPDAAFEASLAQPEPEPAQKRPEAAWFQLFNEIGIIAQLSRAAFEARMPQDLALPQFSVLNHFVRLGDGRSPLDLARAFQVPKTTMTHTLSVLEEKGLVSFAPNPRDGRSKLVYITPPGRAFRDAAIAALGPDLVELQAEFGDGLPDRLLPDLRRLRAQMDAARDG